ncbi:class I adenylate-forming enzyme family protein [Microbacterium sp. No. 7]|uniref:class I adenylate-forming enzyme family protein n=1 Tax=Microbacterium sp. No. 7 TaxID=1714373 RepID=UPI0006D1F416|nr:AMP-binding protein [Microbacterium sp. No. 7]ALJ20852.1 hypothetical protein AOA12_13435 [Microbacterium sp. No. 7]
MTNGEVASAAWNPEFSPTIASVFRRGYVEFADRPAVFELDGSVTTYAELGRAARRLVSGIDAAGIRKGDRVVVLTKNRSECFTIDHALAIGGFVRVALSYRLHAREVTEIISDCGASLVIIDGERAHDLLPELAGFEGVVVCLDRVEGVRHFSELVGDVEADDVDIRPSDLVWMPYTSGTSGRPKGVMHSHRSLLAILRNIAAELPDASADDRLVHVAPVTHLSGYAMMVYFLKGASHLALGEFSPAEYLSVVERTGATVLPLVPTMINMLLPVVDERKPDLSAVRTVIYGGSAIAPDRLARAIAAFGPVFIQYYGLTEMPYNASLSMSDHVFDPALPAPRRLASAGHVSPYVDYRLVDDDEEPVAVGDPGELQVRGDAGMVGYWNLPDETAKTILPGGWISTGDVGQLIDGFLTIVDRKKNMIVSGGFNVYPTEVENVIYTIEAVHEVAVVGIPSAQWGETIHAVVSLKPGHELTLEEIDRVCLGALAAYKRPRSVEFVDELPKTGTGKILHREIRERYWQGQQRRVGG